MPRRRRSRRIPSARAGVPRTRPGGRRPTRRGAREPRRRTARSPRSRPAGSLASASTLAVKVRDRDESPRALGDDAACDERLHSALSWRRSPRAASVRRGRRGKRSPSSPAPSAAGDVCQREHRNESNGSAEGAARSSARRSRVGRPARSAASSNESSSTISIGSASSASPSASRSSPGVPSRSSSRARSSRAEAEIVSKLTIRRSESAGAPAPVPPLASRSWRLLVQGRRNRAGPGQLARRFAAQLDADPDRPVMQARIVVRELGARREPALERKSAPCRTVGARPTDSGQESRSAGPARDALTGPRRPRTAAAPTRASRSPPPPPPGASDSPRTCGMPTTSSADSATSSGTPKRSLPKTKTTLGGNSFSDVDRLARA